MGGFPHTGGSAVAAIEVQDEGVNVVSASTLDFVGAGVTATDGGSGKATITIPGGGGGGLSFAMAELTIPITKGAWTIDTGDIDITAGILTAAAGGGQAHVNLPGIIGYIVAMQLVVPATVTGADDEIALICDDGSGAWWQGIDLDSRSTTTVSRILYVANDGEAPNTDPIAQPGGEVIYTAISTGVFGALYVGTTQLIANLRTAAANRVIDPSLGTTPRLFFYGDVNTTPSSINLNDARLLVATVPA